MTKSEAAIERKKQIVKATVECVSKFGYNNFSMQDVARSAGVSKGIIHYYFLNKDDLMISVLEYVASDIGKMLSTDLGEIEGPEEKLKQFVASCLTIVKKTKEYYQVNMDFWTQINQKDEVRETIARHYRTFRSTCASVISEGIDAGVFKNVDPIEFSSLIIAIIDGVSLQWLFDDSVFDFDKIVESATQLIRNQLVRS